MWQEPRKSPSWSITPNPTNPPSAGSAPGWKNLSSTPLRSGAKASDRLITSHYSISPCSTSRIPPLPLFLCVSKVLVSDHGITGDHDDFGDLSPVLFPALISLLPCTIRATV